MVKVVVILLLPLKPEMETEFEPFLAIAVLPTEIYFLLVWSRFSTNDEGIWNISTLLKVLTCFHFHQHIGQFGNDQHQWIWYNFPLLLVFLTFVILSTTASQSNVPRPENCSCGTKKELERSSCSLFSVDVFSTAWITACPFSNLSSLFTKLLMIDIFLPSYSVHPKTINI